MMHDRGYENNLVMHKTEIFLNVEFGLTWMSDAEARDELKRHFLLQECTYPDITLQHFMIQEYADHSRDYLNRLYELQVHNKEYNPVENYNRYEDWTGKAKSNSSGSSKSNSSDSGNSEGNAFEFPMNTSSKKQVSQTGGKSSNSSQATGSSSANSNSDTESHGHIHGNIGVTTGAQMIQGEIDVAKIIYNLKEEFCKQYEDLFMITM